MLKKYFEKINLTPSLKKLNIIMNVFEEAKKHIIDTS